MSKNFDLSLSPTKGVRKNDQKVQFAELHEIREIKNASKPPEVPRHIVARCHRSSSNLGNLPKTNNNNRHICGRGSNSLERPQSGSNSRLSPSLQKRPSSLRRKKVNDQTLAPALRRSISLEKKPFESEAKLCKSEENKQKDKLNIENRNKYKQINEFTSYGDKGKLLKLKAEGQPILVQNCINRCSNLSEDNRINAFHKSNLSNKNANDSAHKSKRSLFHSPRRLFNKENQGCDKENEKCREKKRELTKLDTHDYTHNSRKDNKLHSNGKSIKTCHFWKFEKDVMWSYNPNGGKRIGYFLFNTLYLENSLTDSVAEKYQMAYKFSQADSKLIRILMESHGFKEVSTGCNLFNLYWGNAHFSPNEIRQLQDWQKINHFPRSSELTRKDRLYTNIKRMQRQYGVKLFDFIPTSFVLPTEYREFCDTHLRERGTWIVKPVASSQGKGIYLVSQVNQVPPDETSLVCRYLESPLLVDGYKCDLRLYVAVTSLDPMIVYMYEEGLVRLATIKYQHGKNLWNPCIHLTNYSVNKFHSNYVQNEDPEVDDRGNKWSLSAFLRHLKARGIDTGALMRSIEDVIIKSLLSASYQMNTAANMFVPHPRNCFELYGFDILIDSQLKPWILEVNLSPSLNIDQPLDLKIKSSMLVDLFSLIGIPVCNPNTSRLNNRPSVYRKLPNLRHSTDSLERSQYSSRWGQTSNGNFIPSVEELRIFRQMREEYERKGGWARIYPTPDSWAMYGTLQEYDSPMNYILHCHLFPNVPRNNRCFRVTPMKMSSVSSSGLASSLERLSCYERALPKGLPFIKNSKRKEEKSTKDLEQVKASLVQALENGLALSKYQARMAFSVYLQHVQRRLMIGCDQEKQTDLVYRFLRSATRTLHLPVNVQAPSKTLPQEARAVVISKQLGDFIQAYTKETHLYLDPQSSTSCSSLSSQCPTSNVPTPSEPTQSSPFETNYSSGCEVKCENPEVLSSREGLTGELNQEVLTSQEGLSSEPNQAVPSSQEGFSSEPDHTVLSSCEILSDESNQQVTSSEPIHDVNQTSLTSEAIYSNFDAQTGQSTSILSVSSLSESSGISSTVLPDSASCSSSVTRQHSLSSLHSSDASLCSSSPSKRNHMISSMPSSSSSISTISKNSSVFASSVPTFSAIYSTGKKKVGFFQNKLRRFKSEGDSGLCSTDDEISNQIDNEDDQSKSVLSRKQSIIEDGIAMELYRTFLSNAGESDLEEVLALQTRMHNSVGVFLDPARKSRSQHSASSSIATTPTSGPASRPRTPTASPHGSPRRARKSPVHTEKGGSSTGEPVVNEPHSTMKEVPRRSSLSASASGIPSLSSSLPSSTCCLFGNILKASLKGTKAPFGN